MLIPIKFDKATAYSVIRWIIKWSIVMAVLMLFWTYALESADAEEARLQRIEARLDSLEAHAIKGATGL